MVSCQFHKEKTPSLRIWPNGWFFCLGCRHRGHTSKYPDLKAKYLTLRANSPAFRNPAQNCFPWLGVKVLDMEEEGPRPTGRQSDVTLTGSYIPWKDDQPVFLNVPGSEKDYLPLFSDPEKLRAVMNRAGAEYESVKRVHDGREFHESIPPTIPIMYDPYFTSAGRVRWIEVQR